MWLPPPNCSNCSDLAGVCGHLTSQSPWEEATVGSVWAAVTLGHCVLAIHA